MNKYFLLFSVLSQCLFCAIAQAEPFRPQDDNQVLVHVTRAHQLQRGGEHLPSATLDQAVEKARSYIEQGRAEADPRFFGYAQAVLRPWWLDPGAPASVLVLRAIIKDYGHDFVGALADLERALELNPRLPQAWLLKANIALVQGDSRRAKESCQRLFGLASQFVTVACLSAAGSIGGQAEQSYHLLSRVIAAPTTVSRSEHIWGLSIVADIAERLGKDDEAGEYYAQALRLNPQNTYVLAALSDFYLRLGKAQQVESLLKEKTNVDSLLLRLAMAEKLLDRRQQFKRHCNELESRFAAERLRGDAVHRREEALYALFLKEDSKQAVQLAQENWKVQREPIDVLLLVRSARASRNQKAMELAEQWIKMTHYEDYRLREFLPESK